MGWLQQAMAVYSDRRSGEDCAAVAGWFAATDELIAKVEASGLTAREKYDLLHELRVKRVQFNDAIVRRWG